VKSKVVAILGADWSRLSLAIVKELTNLGSKIPLISAGATTSLLSNSTEWPNFFRTTYSDSDAILSVLPVLSKLHQAKLGSLSDPPSWAVLYSQEPFGQGGHDTIQGYALSRGEAFQDAGFLSGASLQDLTDLAAKLLSSSASNNKLL
jgi:ABC-type branched-subunit amino acid transport system substrate-binding protein